MGSLADCALADAILITLRPPLQPTTTKMVRGLRDGKGSSKKVRKLITEKIFTSK